MHKFLVQSAWHHPPFRAIHISEWTLTQFLVTVTEAACFLGSEALPFQSALDTSHIQLYLLPAAMS